MGRLPAAFAGKQIPGVAVSTVGFSRNALGINDLPAPKALATPLTGKHLPGLRNRDWPA
jgi:hypothetical protein